MQVLEVVLCNKKAFYLVNEQPPDKYHTISILCGIQEILAHKNNMEW